MLLPSLIPNNNNMMMMITSKKYPCIHLDCTYQVKIPCPPFIHEKTLNKTVAKAKKKKSLLKHLSGIKQHTYSTHILLKKLPHKAIKFSKFCLKNPFSS